jgi:hypothetical protein
MIAIYWMLVNKITTRAELEYQIDILYKTILDMEQADREDHSVGRNENDSWAQEYHNLWGEYLDLKDEYKARFENENR